MGSVTPVVVPGEGYVRVEVNWQDFTHTRRCWISRRLEPAGSPTTLLREGNAGLLSNGVLVAYDHEAPLDVPLVYSSYISLNYNGGFSDGVGEWVDTTNVGTVGTVTQSFDYYVAGESNASLRLLPSGAAASKAASEFIPVTVGTVYTFSAQLMLPDYWTGGVRIQIQWYAGTTLLSSSQGTDDFAPYPGNWATHTVSAAAPATATQCRIAVVVTGTPPTTLPLYVGEAYLTTSAASVSAALPVIVPSAGGGWWTDPLHPATKVRLQTDLTASAASLCPGKSGVAYLGMAEKTRPADSATLEINDGKYPVATWNVRKAARSAIRIGTMTLADLARVEALNASGAPLFFHLNEEYGESDFYGLYGDIAEGRIHGDQRVDWRLLVAPYAESLPPVGPAEGTLGTRYMDFTKYATFAAASSAGGGAYDDYARTVAPGGWGSTTSGAPYTVVGTASLYSVSGGAGLVSMAALSTFYRAQLLSLSLANVDVTITSGLSAALTGTGSSEFGLRVRYVDANNFVDIRLFRNNANVGVSVRQRLLGVDTTTSFPIVAGSSSASTITMRIVAQGSTVTGKAWLSSVPEPATPNVTLTGVTHLAAGTVELAASLASGVTNVLPLTASWKDLTVSNLATNGSATWLDGLQGELVA